MFYPSVSCCTKKLLNSKVVLMVTENCNYRKLINYRKSNALIVVIYKINNMTDAALGESATFKNVTYVLKFTCYVR